MCRATYDGSVRSYLVAGRLVHFCGLIILVVLTLANLAQSKTEPDAFAYNQLLGRGINLGDALDAFREGD